MEKIQLTFTETLQQMDDEGLRLRLQAWQMRQAILTEERNKVREALCTVNQIVSAYNDEIMQRGKNA
nr:MAG: hypothetical protein [Microvirus sp.]